MTSIMAHSTQKCEIISSFLTKCGEISATLFEDRNEFYLNCDFCECSYLQLDNFIQHIYDNHSALLPSKQIKQESATSLHSEESLDCYDIVNAAEENFEDGVKSMGAHKETKDTYFASTDFETVLLAPNEVEIKEEVQENIKIEEDMQPDQTEPHYDVDVTTDDELVSDSEEIPQTRKKSRGKKAQQNINHVENNDVDETIQTVGAFDKRQNDPKPSSRYVKITASVIDVSQRITLAEIYKNHACLWDEKDIAYRFNNRRDDAMESARVEFNNKTELNLTENDFLREVLYLRKICSNEKRKKVACKQKSIAYKTSCTYLNYIDYLEVDVAPYVCSICEQQCRGPTKLKIHEATHDGSQPFKCHVCGRGFQLVHYLTQHLRRHAQDRQFHCEVCNKAFVTSSEVVLHMRKHTGERPFVCYMCGSTHISSSGLIEHIMRHKKERRFKCDICCKAYYSSSRLKAHKKTHSNVCEYICQTCDKGFKDKKHLKQHSLIHDSVKRYICKICGKRFAQYAGLSGHMKSHGTTLTSNSTDINPK